MLTYLPTNQVHYVYLLVDKDHHRFKIGVSVDPVRRARTLKQNFNLYMSVQTGFNRTEAYSVERLLHDLYADLNIDERVLGMVDGKTEWFCFDAYPACFGVLQSLPAVVATSRVSNKKKRTTCWVSQCFDYIDEFGTAHVMRKLHRQQGHLRMAA